MAEAGTAQPSPPSLYTARGRPLSLSPLGGAPARFAPEHPFAGASRARLCGTDRQPLPGQDECLGRDGRRRGGGVRVPRFDSAAVRAALAAARSTTATVPGAAAAAAGNGGAAPSPPPRPARIPPSLPETPHPCLHCLAATLRTSRPAAFTFTVTFTGDRAFAPPR